MYKRGIRFRPKEILFSPTTRCNLACTHCDIKRDKGVLPVKTAKRFLSECKSLGIKRVGFTGGEPFLAGSFLCYVASQAVKEGMLFSRIMTNGVWYKTKNELEKTLLKLYACGYDGEISLSIDAFHRQNLTKIVHFIKTALSIWRRPDTISIVCVRGAKNESTRTILRHLARMLKASLISFDGTHPRIKGRSLFIRINKIDLSPIGTASGLKNGWDGKWFKEDYCKGPGNVFFVLPSGDVKPCCGYATDSKRLTIGNIKHDSAKAIMKKAGRNRLVSAIFNSGLTEIRKALEARGVVFPGKTSNNCYFCSYILKKALVTITLLMTLIPSADAGTQILKRAKDYAVIETRTVNKVTLPKWYHEGLLYDGQNVWVLNGKNGKAWVVDAGSGVVRKEIEHVAGFAEGMTKRDEDTFYITDWNEKKLYTVRIEENKMIPLSDLSLAPAFPAGVVWNGRDLFIITWTRRLTGTRFDILQMNERLELIRKIAVKYIPEPSQLAWDGQNLWITSWFKRLVYKVDINNWKILGAFKSPVTRTTGIVWDGKYMWVTGTYSGLYQLEIGKREEDPMSISVTSSAFKEGGMIPRKYTCDGDDISPPLAWSGIQQNTRTIALISDDPDAPMGTWVHWVLFNMPPDTKGLPEGVTGDKVLTNGAKQGINDGRQIGYGGPCPPSGTHRYYFKVYALDKELDLSPGCTKKDLVKAMEGHILAEGQLMGRYKR